ncbi:DsrE family protein [Sulfobacillus harzensis]|uniref:Sulfur reduction protein DsrE n=1 Tax=Sulfobacillus harzensis TaxID=2729629 RepID=A0A7Y0L2U4_9FIRM|nr:DsrE family protein [Sulfobacillus harzensis]NMP20859.1 sulfur reduction protein DsrE [Sulfobacillus harzensis]
MAHQRFLVNLTRSPKEDPDRVTVAFVMANAALGLDKEAVVLLSTEGVWAGVPKEYQRVHEDQFAPLGDLIEGFLDGGGEIWACTPCVEKRGLSDSLDSRIKRVGAVSAIAWVSEEGVSFSF